MPTEGKKKFVTVVIWVSIFHHKYSEEDKMKLKKAQPPLARRLGGTLPINLNYRHPEVGSDPEGIGVPPGAGEMGR
jgi:hypothetical protein